MQFLTPVERGLWMVIVVERSVKGEEMEEKEREGSVRSSLSRREEEQQMGETAGKACSCLRGAESEYKVSGCGWVGMEEWNDWGSCRGPLKVRESRGLIRCFRNNREKHFLWQEWKKINECAFKWISCLCFRNGDVPRLPGDLLPQLSHPLQAKLWKYRPASLPKSFYQLIICKDSNHEPKLQSFLWALGEY